MAITDPPQPPQKQIFSSGSRAPVVAPGQPEADAPAQRDAEHQIDVVDLAHGRSVDGLLAQQADPVYRTAAAITDITRAPSARSRVH